MLAPNWREAYEAEHEGAVRLGDTERADAVAAILAADDAEREATPPAPAEHAEPAPAEIPAAEPVAPAPQEPAKPAPVAPVEPAAPAS